VTAACHSSPTNAICSRMVNSSAGTTMGSRKALQLPGDAIDDALWVATRLPTAAVGGENAAQARQQVS
jgi:hypothetical protein